MNSHDRSLEDVSREASDYYPGIYCDDDYDPQSLQEVADLVLLAASGLILAGLGCVALAGAWFTGALP